MFQAWKTYAIATFVIAGLVIGVVPVSAQERSADELINQGVAATSYYPPQRYSSGPSIEKHAATNTYPQFFYEARRYKDLDGGYVDVEVPYGKYWLFNVAFSAECRLFDRDKKKFWDRKDNDALLIRVKDVRTDTFLQPYDGGQAFCSEDSYATHKGNWVYVFGEGKHRIQVQFYVKDDNRKDRLFGYIDDWTLEVVAYVDGKSYRY